MRQDELIVSSLAIGLMIWWFETLAAPSRLYDMWQSAQVTPLAA